MTDDEVRARLAIMQTISSYTYFGDTGQVQRFADLFGADGVLKVVDREVRGSAEIVAFAQEIGGNFGSKPGFLPARHHVSSIYIELLDAEHAKAHSYFELVSALGADHWGRYKDQFVLRDGQWLFAYRHAIVEGTTEDSAVRDKVRTTT